MRALKILLGIIVVLVAIFFLVGLMLPERHSISRSVEINAPDSTVYNYVLDYQNFKSWSPWYDMEPTAKTQIIGNKGEKGYGYSWEGQEVGSGSMLVKKIEPLKGIYQDLLFTMPFASQHSTSFLFERTGNGTKVTWTMDGANNSIFERWMYSVLMNRFIEKDYDKGLNKLKAVIEGQKP